MCFIKIKNICVLKETIKKVKRHQQNERKHITFIYLKSYNHKIVPWYINYYSLLVCSLVLLLPVPFPPLLSLSDKFLQLLIFLASIKFIIKQLLSLYYHTIFISKLCGLNCNSLILDPSISPPQWSRTTVIQWMINEYLKTFKLINVI